MTRLEIPIGHPLHDPRNRILLAVLVLAAIARTVPIFGDFWLDEIWTYFFALDLNGGVEVFTRNHHSNNHHLNSLFFVWIGDTPHWPLYRIPSLVAGIGSVLLATVLGRRHGRLEGLLSAALVGGSFALIHFSSEARGYAPAVFFALAATWFLDRALARRDGWNALGFGLCVSLGILSQLVFLFYYAGAVAQSAWRLLRTSAGVRAFARLHVLPLACFAALYHVNLRYLHVGRGDPFDRSELLAEAIGYTFGLPIASELAMAYAILACAILLAGLLLLVRERDDAAILMAIAIAGAPLAVLGVLRPEVIALRYFLIALTLLLLLAARLLANAFHAGGPRAFAATLALAVFAFGNAVHTLRFFEHGRGDYLAALSYMAEHSDGPIVRVASDHDFRTGTVLRFYERFLPGDKQLRYYRAAGRPQGGSEWMLSHRSDGSQPPPPMLRDARGNPYRFERDFEHAAISGFHWALYRAVGTLQSDRERDAQPARSSPGEAKHRQAHSREAEAVPPGAADD